MSVLRGAYQKMAKNPDFIKATTNLFGKGWYVRPGKETRELGREVTTVSKEVQEYLRNLRVQKGLPPG